MFENIALVDADSIYFRIACVQKKKNEIRKGIDYTMNNIMRDTGAMKAMVGLKGKGNFRHGIYDKYKANRKELEPDMKEALAYGHNYMVEKYDGVMAVDMEADDLVAIWAAECRDMEVDYTVVGIDKDLLQIPGRHYNFVKKVITDVTPEEGHYNLMKQCLTGDTADNIPGIKGIGPKKAEKILHGVPMERQWMRVKAAWRQHRAGNPAMSRRLLEMLTTWEEHEDIKQSLQDKTSVSEPNVGSEGKENV